MRIIALVSLAYEDAAGRTCHLPEGSTAEVSNEIAHALFEDGRADLADPLPEVPPEPSALPTPIAMAELAEGEPTNGGIMPKTLGIYERASLWGEPPSEEETRQAALAEGLVVGKFRCAGFPFHTPGANRRVWVPAAVYARLIFKADEAFDQRWADSDGTAGLCFLQFRAYPTELFDPMEPGPVAPVPAPNHPLGAPAQKQRRRQSEIEKAAEAVYAERADDPPNLIEAEKLIRERLPGATRDQIRPILRQPQFEELRRPAGKPILPG